MKLLSTAFLALGVLLAAPARASDSADPPQLGEAVYATRIDSDVSIGPEGTILRYTPITPMDEPFASRARALAEGFRFEPVQVDGRPGTVDARMRMHLTAEPLGDGQVRMNVERVSFPPHRQPGAAQDAGAHPYIHGILERAPVKYPVNASINGASGRVLVAVRLAADGSVADAVARESALYAAERQPRVLRSLSILERAAVQAVRRWRFDLRIPQGARLMPQDLTGLVIVQYFAYGHGAPQPGLWTHETRSRKRALPWLDPALAGQLPDMSDVGEGGHFGLSAAHPKLLQAPGAAL